MKTRLKVRRAELNITQDELAEKSGVARSIISQIESGRRDNITFDTMKRLTNALECKISDIFLEE